MAIPSTSMERTARAYVEYKETPDDEKEKKRKKRKVNLPLIIILLIIITFVIAILRALPEGSPIMWLLTTPELPETVGDLATVLGPLLAVAVAIERILETSFDTLEQSTRSVADVLTAPKETLDWIGVEYKEAYESAKKAAENTGIEITPGSIEKLEKAEERLSKAEARLRSWSKSPEYIARKRALSIWIGLLVGLIVAVLADLGMLHIIGIPAPRILDMVITGLVIGAGPGPMHSLIGILQSGKDAVNNLAELAKGNALKAEIEALRKATNED